ncbi:MAG: inositol monophosphatase family protein [Vicinamibacterales bacterium]
MTLDSLGPEAAFAARVMADAARLALTVRVAGDDVESKQDESPVTIADFAVQAFVSGRLAAARPGDTLVGEEDAGELRQPSSARLRGRVLEVLRPFEPGMDEATLLDAIDRGAGAPSDRYWTLDPIDGTKGSCEGPVCRRSRLDRARYRDDWRNRVPETRPHRR